MSYATDQAAVVAADAALQTSLNSTTAPLVAACIAARRTFHGWTVNPQAPGGAVADFELARVETVAALNAWAAMQQSAAGPGNTSYSALITLWIAR